MEIAKSAFTSNHNSEDGTIGNKNMQTTVVDVNLYSAVSLI